jgi:hypothetical protein
VKTRVIVYFAAILSEASPKLQYRSTATTRFHRRLHVYRKASLRSTNSRNESKVPARKRNPPARRRKFKVKDNRRRRKYRIRKVVPREYFPSMYHSKFHRRHYKRRSRHYDLGSRMGYHWMLYGSPFKHHRRYRARHLLRHRVKSHWRRYAKHLLPKSAFLPHQKSRHYVHPRSRSILAGLKGRPIVVSIHPSFTAYNMRSASVLGYGLGALLEDVALATKLKIKTSKKKNKSYYH